MHLWQVDLSIVGNTFDRSISLAIPFSLILLGRRAAVTKSPRERARELNFF
jgi:hypothetical protein